MTEKEKAEWLVYKFYNELCKPVNYGQQMKEAKSNIVNNIENDIEYVLENVASADSIYDEN